MKPLKFLIIPFLLTLVSCASNESYSDAAVQRSAPSFSSERQITRSTTLWLDVVNIDEKANTLTTLVDSYGGYVNSTSQHSEKRNNFDIKVPSSKLDAFIDELATIGEITRQSASTRDVTDNLIDIEAKLENLLALRKRYRELLSKADTVKDMLAIEKELSKVQTQIDSINARRKSLKDQVAMSSVSVHLQEETVYGPLGYVLKGVAWSIGKLFVIK